MTTTISLVNIRHQGGSLKKSQSSLVNAIWVGYNPLWNPVLVYGILASLGLLKYWHRGREGKYGKTEGVVSQTASQTKAGYAPVVSLTGQLREGFRFRLHASAGGGPHLSNFPGHCCTAQFETRRMWKGGICRYAIYITKPPWPLGWSRSAGTRGLKLHNGIFRLTRDPFTLKEGCPSDGD